MTVPGLAMRERYLADSIATASPAKLLTMLYDRLVLDLNRGEAAVRVGDRETASQQLMHAQDIVLELRTSLNVSTWSGATGLAQLYTFLFSELIGANVNADADRVAGCQALVEPLRDAWHEAVHAAVVAPDPAAARVG